MKDYPEFAEDFAVGSVLLAICVVLSSAVYALVQVTSWQTVLTLVAYVGLFAALWVPVALLLGGAERRFL